MIMVSFLVFILGFALIGISASRWSKRSTTDYLVAGRGVSPWLTALSSMATNNSGYAFVGLVGFAYRFGLSSLWLSLAWVIGDTLVWIFVHRRVRQYSGATGTCSVPSLLATDLKGTMLRPLAFSAGLVTFLFLAVYAGAQLKAGATALHGLLGLDLNLGIGIGTAIVVLYCFAGGLRASIWTDSAQSWVMMAGMALMMGFSLYEVGGPHHLVAGLNAQDAALAEVFPGDMSLGFPLYFLGFVAGGFGAIGAPHILIRTMALKSVDVFRQTRRIYLLTFVPFVFCSAVIGLYARVLLPELAVIPDGVSAELGGTLLVQQAESALPHMAQALLPEIAVGLILAALFAATLSTADSQILSCSAAVTQDMFPRFKNSYVSSKLATLAVATLSMLVAMFAGEGVFSLVLIAWSALAAILGPLLLVRLFGGSLSNGQGLTMMVSGLTTVVVWNNGPFSQGVYSVLPGILVPLMVYVLARFLGRRNAVT